MKPTPPRPFTLLDALILVAATAAALALVRATEKDLAGFLTSYSRGLRYATDLGVRVAVPFLMTWTPAFLVLRLLRPRPRWRTLARQPGTVAGVAATMAIAYELLWIPLALLRFQMSYQTLWMKGFLPTLRSPFPATAVAFWVAWAWLTLALSGRWRPARDWVERLGRALGLAWLLAWFIPLVEGILPR